MLHDVALRATGRAEVPAYGLADAEHQVEKEVRDAWPGATVEVLDVSRTGGTGRIVEEFAVRFRAQGTVPVEADSEEDARRAALRHLRAAFADTRYHRLDFQIPERDAGHLP
jgi:hypothetical protein